jgi:hypothetical protein
MRKLHIIPYYCLSSFSLIFINSYINKYTHVYTFFFLAQPDPTPIPTHKPTLNPTPAPTTNPTLNPTSAPTPNPTLYPTPAPTPRPSPQPIQKEPTVDEFSELPPAKYPVSNGIIDPFIHFFSFVGLNDRYCYMKTSHKFASQFLSSFFFHLHVQFDPICC